MSSYVKMMIPRDIWLESLKSLPISLDGYYSLTFVVPSCTPIAYIDTIHGRIWARGDDTVSVPIQHRDLLNLQKQYSDLMTKNIHGRKMVLGPDIPLLIIGCVKSSNDGDCIYGNTYAGMFAPPDLGNGGPQPGEGSGGA